jgi:hypothetical protein
VFARFGWIRSSSQPSFNCNLPSMCTAHVTELSSGYTSSYAAISSF